MALFGSNRSTEVGLRLLLCPIGSNVVVKTACCSVGIGLPVYSTFRAIETGDQNEQQKWLLYWAAYGSFSIVELFTDKFLYWCPFYYPMKFAFLVWLQLPTVDGARQLYINYLRPFLLRHQCRLDQIVGFLYSEMAKFSSDHLAEIQFMKTLVMRILTSGNCCFLLLFRCLCSLIFREPYPLPFENFCFHLFKFYSVSFILTSLAREFARDATGPANGHVTGVIGGPSSHREHGDVTAATDGPSRLAETSESENED